MGRREEQPCCSCGNPIGPGPEFVDRVEAREFEEWDLPPYPARGYARSYRLSRSTYDVPWRRLSAGATVSTVSSVNRQCSRKSGNSVVLTFTNSSNEPMMSPAMAPSMVVLRLLRRRINPEIPPIDRSFGRGCPTASTRQHPRGASCRPVAGVVVPTEFARRGSRLVGPILLEDARQVPKMGEVEVQVAGPVPRGPSR